MPIAVHVARHRALPPAYSGEGFAAFYCAGAAVRERRDPYATEPLRACETRTGAVPAGVPEPAPLPPVTLAWFAWLAGFPFRTATVVWLGVLLTSVAFTGVFLVRVAPRVPPVAIWAALAPGLFALDGFFGETPAVVAAGLALAAYGLALGRSGVAAVVAGVTLATLFEPHVGGAAWLALFLAVPYTRVPLAASAVLLAAVGVLTAGFGTTIEYVTAVLPAHARSELPANDQYSLTSFLFQVGVPGGVALLAGAASYLATLVVGCVAAPHLARRFASPPMLVLFPAASVLLGGTFIHDLQLPLAVPLAVLVADGSTRTTRPLAFLCLLVGAVPEPWSALPVVAFGAAAAFAAAWSAPGASGAPSWRGLRVVAGAAGGAAYAVLAFAVHRLGRVPLGFHDSSPLALAPGTAGLAEAGWTAYVRAVSHPLTAGELLARVVAAALLVTILVLAARSRRARVPWGANPDGAGASRA